MYGIDTFTMETIDPNKLSTIDIPLLKDVNYDGSEDTGMWRDVCDVSL